MTGHARRLVLLGPEGRGKLAGGASHRNRADSQPRPGGAQASLRDAGLLGAGPTRAEARAYFRPAADAPNPYP